jgi:hypothetical protein
MEYFKKINLICEPSIRDFVIADVKRKLNPDTVSGQVRIKHDLPADLRYRVNTELESLGFPKFLYCQSYIRQQGNVQGIHIDGDVDKKINAAINIPIQGIEGSTHNWYDGDYTLVLRNVGDLVFHQLVWNSKPTLVSSLILDQPYLVRVDQPHSASAGSFHSRWIFTMRFVGNPTFEHLCSLLPTQTFAKVT